MKPLRPILIMTLGPILLATTLTIAIRIVEPQPADAPAIARVFLGGIIVGLFTFLPFVLGEHTRSRFICRHLPALDRWTVLLLGMGTGHLLLMNLGENAILVAVFLATVAGLSRVYLAGQARQIIPSNGSHP